MSNPCFKYIEPSKKYAHVIVPRGGKNKVALDTIKSRVNELLTNSALNKVSASNKAL
ncbi:Uridine kinase [Hyalomma marginatum]|uniref:Uridine kinase n=1 Tax=Hyalomma marginatum TaxID=34627 RepID=A0A8S4C2L8_9ACAR|nr:Uridine kinase [Hyalomma marginatum]CAG7598523.1 Uridine kinase [Hyalomma marginatum]